VGGGANFTHVTDNMNALVGMCKDIQSIKYSKLLMQKNTLTAILTRIDSFKLK